MKLTLNIINFFDIIKEINENLKFKIFYIKKTKQIILNLLIEKI